MTIPRGSLQPPPLNEAVGRDVCLAVVGDGVVGLGVGSLVSGSLVGGEWGRGRRGSRARCGPRGRWRWRRRIQRRIARGRIARRRGVFF